MPVSNQSDWRWIDKSIHKGCYWYNTIDVAYQEEDGNWKKAVEETREWILKTIKN